MTERLTIIGHFLTLSFGDSGPPSVYTPPGHSTPAGTYPSCPTLSETCPSNPRTAKTHNPPIQNQDKARLIGGLHLAPLAFDPLQNRDCFSVNPLQNGDCFYVNPLQNGDCFYVNPLQIGDSCSVSQLTT